MTNNNRKIFKHNKMLIYNNLQKIHKIILVDA